MSFSRTLSGALCSISVWFKFRRILCQSGQLNMTEYIYKSITRRVYGLQSFDTLSLCGKGYKEISQLAGESKSSCRKHKLFSLLVRHFTHFTQIKKNGQLELKTRLRILHGKHFPKFESANALHYEEKQGREKDCAYFTEFLSLHVLPFLRILQDERRERN